MHAFFLPVHGSDRFCLFHPPVGELRGALVYVHPLAEEMNLSRRMAALQARAFAAAGYAVLQMDLFGCGDSAGDFSAASWSQWRDDVLAADHWLQAETGVVPIFWGLRAGCLLAAEAAQSRDRVTTFVFWQPVVAGEQHWRQWLRLRQARGLLAAASDVPDVLPEGQIELGGYEFSRELVTGLCAAQLELPPQAGRIVCVEVTGTGTPNPALQTRIERWQEEGRRLQCAALPGPTFWQTPEVPDSTEMIAATLALLA